MKFTKRARVGIHLLAAAFGSAVLLLSLSCQQKETATANQPAPQRPAPTQKAEPTPSTETKSYYGAGVITKIVPENPYDKSLASVELDHGEIVGLMPPMKMEFYVKEKSMVKGLKVGDKVDFTIEDTGGAEKISEIKKKK